MNPTRPTRPALRTDDAVTTYGELRDQVARARGLLQSLGVGPGDRVALVAATGPRFVVAYLATLGLGAVSVPLNPTSPTAELRREIDAVGAKVVVVGVSGREAVAGLDGLTVIDDLFGDSASSAPAPLVDRDADDLAVLIFTAGTAGSPKPAMLSHGNLLSNLEQIQQHPGRRVETTDVSLGVLPMFHIFGLNVVLGADACRGRVDRLARAVRPRRSLAAIKQHGVTLVAGAPPMYSAWAGLPEDEASDSFATVRLATSGAAPLSDEVAAAFEARFGLPIHQGYGLTEASPVVSSSLVGEPPRPGSDGPAAAGGGGAPDR